ncbi:lysosomal alpha-glucosidase-like isoform X2 [Dermacentor albipictus]|uniref:lysosomal alpha-glucosidase-like isoform X2 n=1 Tax=Dermacentor albipictus TaxID=60249 RepID=UPI0031FE0B9D
MRESPGTAVVAVTSPDESTRSMASATFTYIPSRAGAGGGKKGLQESSLELLGSIPEESSLSHSSGGLQRSLRGPLLCGLASLLISAAVLASCAVLVYVEVYYRWSFPLRVDCNLDPTGRAVDYGRCLRRGCKYVSTDGVLPTCFFPEGYGYVKESEERHVDGSGFTTRLRRPDLPPLFGGEFDEVVVNVSFLTPSRLRVQMIPEAQSFQSNIFVDDSSQRCNEHDTAYEVSQTESGQSFGLVVTRKENSTVILDTRLPGTVLAEQFLQLSTRLTTANVFGLGGLSTKESLKHDINWKTITFFNKRSQNRPSEYFGVHPFYMVVEEDGKANGVFLRSSNAMDVLLQPEKVITFRTTGGTLDFYIFLGDNPDDVVRQFTELVGRPAMPPFWALGHHISLDAEADLSQVWPLLQKLRKEGLDVAALHLNEGFATKKIVTDDSWADKIRQLRNETENSGTRYLLRADPLLPSSAEHMIPLILSEGSKSDVAFVDFTNPDAEKAWTECLRSLNGAVGFDGLLLDLNEPTYPREGNQSSSTCTANKWNNPPYPVGFQHGDTGIFENSVCGDVNQSSGMHYNLHNLYGYHHSETTWKSLLNLTEERGRQRPMILSRATFSGSGSFGGHWFEEPECSWQGLRRTIVKAVEFSMLGMPLVGGYCGLSREREDACLAWLQASALLPLSITRMRPAEDTEAEDVTTRLMNASAASLAARRLLLAYMYTVFYEAHLTGSAVVRAPFYEFPTDPYAMNISHQFLWGSAVLVSPRVKEDNSSVEAYFPAGQWCDLYTGEAINLHRGGYVTLDGDKVPLHVKGGSIIPLLRPVDDRSSTATKLELFVSPDQNGEATGFLFWDDGITYYEDMTKAPAIRLNLTLTKEQRVSKLSISALGKSYEKQAELMIDSVTVCNAASSPTSVLLDGNTSVNATYDSNLQVLKMEALSMDAPSHVIAITF